MKKTRLISLFLAFVLGASAFTSCAQKNEEKETNQPAVDENVEVEHTSADDVDFTSMSFVERIKYASAQINDDLPANKYDGASFVIMSNTTTKPVEFTGDLVPDAQYQQELTIEERFDVDMKYINAGTSGWDGYVNGIKTWFAAGDDFCDILANWNTSTAEFTSSGFFVDLSQFDCIDITKPWYFGEEMKLYSYKDHMFTATGTMDVEDVMGRFNVAIFNKDIHSQYNIENLYEVVREGRWTLDYVKGLTGDFYTDVNGNGEKDDDDIYGLSYARAASWMNLAPILGVPQMNKDSNGELYLSVVDDAEHTEIVLDAMKELLAQTGSRCTSDWGYDAFTSGKALLCMCEMSMLNALRDGTFDYGLLPYFKYDEKQADYYSSYLPDPWSIPISAKDKEMSAVIMTALAAEGYKQVLPSFYETAIKSKYSTDEESGEMLDIMLSNVRGDAMFMYGDGGYIYNLWGYFDSAAGFGSYWKAKSKLIEKQLEKLLEKYAAVSGE